MQTFDTIVNQGDSVPESTEKVKSKPVHLRFGCFDSGRVLVFFLEVCEEQLARCGIVCILAGQHCLHTKLE